MRWVAAVVLVPAIAAAHAVDHPRRITLNPVETRLIHGGSKSPVHIQLQLGPAESAQTKRLFDRDRDGRLSTEEQALLEGYLRKRAVGAFRLECDGKPVELRWSGLFTSGVDDNGDLLYLARAAADVQWGACVVEDGGDAEGHVPVRVENADVKVDLPPSIGIEGAWDLPAHTPTKFRITPRTK